MKLPSISQAVANARNTFVRFPFVILDAIVGTACALLIIDNQEFSGPSVLIQIVFGAILGLPLLTGLTFTSEKWKRGRSVSLGMQIAGIVSVGLYATTVPQDFAGVPAIHTVRLLMLALGMVLFVFAAPYLRHENELEYWSFCKTLCLRVIIACLYTVVLWAGIAIAFAALTNLFGVDIPAKRYGELCVFLNGLFAPWFFLAGVPKNLNSLDGKAAPSKSLENLDGIADQPKSLDTLGGIADYPKGLKMFSQYILFPLVFVYFGILYAYLGKILLAWDWPEGWVSRLILGFIATGLTSLLLVHPIRDRIENVWIKKVSRWFYVIIIPLTVMLFLAVWQRVSEYGITEGRYLGIATVVWLCVLTPYFIFSKQKKIIFHTASLCVTVFVVSFGPWGMFAVSEKSQVCRLREILVNNRMLVDGRVQKKHDSLQFETNRQISSILDYLSEMHGYDAIQPWFGESLKQDTAVNGNAYKDPTLVAKMMGIMFVRVWESGSGGTVTLTADRDGVLDIEGYERLLRGRRILSGGTNREFSDHGIAYRIGHDINMMTVTVWRETNPADSLQISLKPLVDSLVAEYGKASMEKIPPEKMAIVAANQSLMIKIFLSTIRIQRHDGKPDVTSFEIDIAYKQ